MLRRFWIMLLLAFSAVAWGMSYTMEISEQELQEKVSAMMPIEKKALFVTVLISDPRVDLKKDSNEIGIYMNVDVRVPGVAKGSGRGEIAGTLSYDPESGAFYLHNPFIESLEVDHLPKKYLLAVNRLAQSIIQNAMAAYPVYQLKDDDVQQQLTKAVLESVAVENEQLLITMNVF